MTYIIALDESVGIFISITLGESKADVTEENDFNFSNHRKQIHYSTTCLNFHTHTNRWLSQ